MIMQIISCVGDSINDTWQVNKTRIGLVLPFISIPHDSNISICIIPLLWPNSSFKY